MLELRDLNAWYGPSHVVHGVSFDVRAGEVLALIGRNGAGKTTTIKSVMGLIDKVAGWVRFDGQELLMLPAHARFRLGLAYVPEDRRIVPDLTVRENLRLGLLQADPGIKEAQAIDGIAETFPRLKERLGQTAVTMSGGEQQMLAIARAMIARPKMILLDEPSEGIMPVLVEEMGRLFRSLRDQGTTLLLVEQNVEWALNIADRAVIIDQGEIVFEGDAQALANDREIQERYCAV
ncbi:MULTISPECIES: ABC transporter ATP-binding protein [Rhodopseudomonas]|uniref:ABC transporter ATP-binding protein n=1 Tax=Rhodopseudomonas palustris TaxID=1076 RepID=A0A0D7EMU5_RHOPL|nr:MULTISPECIES: ABC transporter ATP-binding protein [Rhodopseudomonas]KIZ40747.1 ABC transporter ATP-binding protein [Rhodopseudomonas palustris]MDF3813751.1 ABC transporter ATP-binding protein [Rhodopseudomonas sp. BAL398]WOK17636.1 ABC transporter ATP-binding protein [Rhodopseudomonas sp. BAL398]